MLKRTALFECHKNLGARLIEFGGWEMPVQYTSIVDEHLAVRSHAGIFDISHMGQFFVKGAGAEKFLNRILTNDIRKLQNGQGQYTLMCNETGGVIDDLYAYRLAEGNYFLIVNASRIGDDFAWISKQTGDAEDFQLENASDRYSAVAVQGPRVFEFIDQCFETGEKAGAPAIKSLKKNDIVTANFDGTQVLIGVTGYTGEQGVEIVAPNQVIQKIWETVLEKGKTSGIKPAGLGARDTLRTEVCYPLYGHELNEQTTPIEAGVGFFVSLEKGDFIGRTVLESQKKAGPPRKCVAFKMTGSSPPPRPHYRIISAENAEDAIGEVVSGTQSPSLNIGIGMGYVPAEQAVAGRGIQIEIRGKLFPATIVSKPIYKKVN